MTASPPTVRWVAEAPGAGLYVWCPRIERWQCTEVRDDGVINTIARELPAAAQVLVPLSDVGNTLDFYRDQLDACCWPDSEQHEDAKAAALAELVDPHRHAEQFGVAAVLCHDHDRHGYHCHDLARNAGAMYQVTPSGSAATPQV